jgi:hypothetical protein
MTDTSQPRPAISTSGTLGPLEMESTMTDLQSEPRSGRR